MSQDAVSRRTLLKVAGTAGVAAAVPAGAQTPAADTGPPAATGPAAATPAALTPHGGHRHVLTEPEAAFLAAAAARLIPGDGGSPSAAEAGFVTYIDRQLAGAYGSGERLYLQGPWKTGTSRQGYQLRYSPRELYRTALGGIARLLQARAGDGGFAALAEGEQDEFLRELERGAHDLDGVPSAVFFETLLANVIESYFADPVHGGNQNMAGWRLVGFPGAYAAYTELVEDHGRPFERRPMSIAEPPLMHPGAAHRHGG